MTNKKNNRYKGKSEPQPNPKNVVDEQQLAVECFAVHELLKNRTAKLRELQDNELCYILSTKWLRQWKEYAGYAALTDSEEENTSKKDKKYGKRHPGKINTDIVAHESESREFYTIPAEMAQYQYLNQIINEKKYKDDDYIAVTKDIWETFIQFYQGQEIRRPVRRLKGSTYYDSEPLRCDVIFANIEEEGLEERIKKTSKKNYNTVFSNDKLLLPTIWTIKQLTEFVSEYCSIHYGSSKIHIWKGFHYVPTNPLMEHLVEGIRDRKFLVKARELTEQRYGDKDIDKYIKNTHTLIVEIGDILKMDPTEQDNIKGYCQECIQKKELIISCVCKEVIYCSFKCRINDQTYHYDTCSAAFDSDDDEQYEKKVIKDTPIAGIQNIGNTCYMNSIIQMILSLNHIREFFSENLFLDHMNEKQLKDNNCMVLRKFSKTVKGLIEEQTVTPWPLKGQIDYNLTPFKGDKQHDANDFLVNFLNLINDYLKKEGDKAYHKILEPFIGEFHSKVICPNCNIQSENNQIFLQISLPIKAKVKQQLYQYAVVQNPIKYIKGKSQLSEDWNHMKLRVNAKDSLVFTIKEPEGLVRVDEQEKSPEKITKGMKGELLYYKNLREIEGEHIFIFSMLTAKVICGSKIKSPYGLPIPISVDHMKQTLGSFWLQIIKTFFFQNENIVQQAERFEREYFEEIENQIKNQKPVKEEAKQQKTADVYEQPEDLEAKKIVDAYNIKLKLFAERIGIEVYVNDFKKNRNICKFCTKKCTGCDLPKIFDRAFEDYFDGKYNEVRFEVYLRQTLQVEIIQQDKCMSGQPTIHDCLSLFTQPEQLDEQNAWYCENCDSMALALKQLHIKTFPPLLMIHLNRFKNIDGKKMKNTEPILYEEYQEFEGVNYRLVGVVVHEGSMDAGHYWAIGLRDDKYYIFNDAKVSQVDKIFNKNAYILLYGRIDFIK